MSWSRRRVLALGVGALGAGVAYRLIKGHGIAGHALDVINRIYGPQIARQDAATEFAYAYEEFVLEKGIEGKALDLGYWSGLHRLPYAKDVLGKIDDSVIDKFATSTNVIRAAEDGLPLEFVALFEPYHTPCLNQLGAFAVS
ncbi:hypothetical protein [Ruegeria lacuscaerulensis]|uniref:hypothetical protein n=1 Tax=Ruegeria lacuscaerulensis TaxID=55218 RepID=UPI00147FC65D|nr:hypothetical protein [Ruegeria lacuscaerulensis]